jgi:hypothetical protein
MIVDAVANFPDAAQMFNDEQAASGIRPVRVIPLAGVPEVRLWKVAAQTNVCRYEVSVLRPAVATSPTPPIAAINLRAVIACACPGRQLFFKRRAKVG